MENWSQEMMARPQQLFLFKGGFIDNVHSYSQSMYSASKVDKICTRDICKNRQKRGKNY